MYSSKNMRSDRRDRDAAMEPQCHRIIFSAVKFTTMTTYSNSSNGNGNSNDYSKKEEFRRYLEKTGVLDALTKVLVGLYEEPERPTNALGYIKQYMGAPSNVDVEGLKRENEDLKRQVEKLRKQVGDKS